MICPQVVTTGPAVLVLNEHAAAVVAIGGQDVCGICRYLGALQFQADAQIAGEMVQVIGQSRVKSRASSGNPQPPPDPRAAKTDYQRHEVQAARTRTCFALPVRIN